MQACLNQPVEEWPTAEDLIEHLKPSLYKQFKPAFLGRMRVVPYFPLHDDLLVRIIKHKLGKITARIEKQYGTEVQYWAYLGWSLEIYTRLWPYRISNARLEENSRNGGKADCRKLK